MTKQKDLFIFIYSFYFFFMSLSLCVARESPLLPQIKMKLKLNFIIKDMTNLFKGNKNDYEVRTMDHFETLSVKFMLVLIWVG